MPPHTSVCAPPRLPLLDPPLMWVVLNSTSIQKVIWREKINILKTQSKTNTISNEKEIYFPLIPVIYVWVVRCTPEQALRQLIRAIELIYKLNTIDIQQDIVDVLAPNTTE